ncbi:hypothetical protein CLOP_g20489 [Closterium sp. NIES-67]|nr:hypothetical protein CLOP_g20489 [Closterium sp. NIES-67]
MATGWLRGRVKAVTSGDCLVIMGNVKSGPPPEKTLTLASLIAPKMARRDGRDEPFAWESREFLRKKCIGQEVVFKVDYAVPSIHREFGNVFMGDTNIALAIVQAGWARVRPQVGSSTDVSPYLEQLLKAEEAAKAEELGIWTKVPGAAEAAIRDLPPSGVGQDTGFDAHALLEQNKGLTLAAIVEQVRDGSTVRVMLLPSFHYVQVYLAGVQCPSVGRRPFVDSTAATAAADAAGNGVGALSLEEGSTEEAAAAAAGGAPSAAQRLAASAAAAEQKESGAEPFALEAKHFTEVRCLNREVRVVLEGVDGKFSNLVGTLHYPSGDSVVNLSLELVQNGLAKVVEWSANMLEASAKGALKSAELESKKQRLRMWTNFVPPQSNSIAFRDNFTGKVVEVVSGDCIVVADDAAAEGTPQAERRVNLSSIRAKKMGNPRRDEKPEPYAREAKEFLRSRLIGQPVAVQMEYTRKMPPMEAGGPEGRNMEFGSAFLLTGKTDTPAPAAPATTASGDAAPAVPAGGVNVAEMLVTRGLATVVRHRDFEERSSQYDALLAAEAKAVKQKKNIHSNKDAPATHINDLSLHGMANKARGFLPFLQRGKRMAAVVDYVLSGHRFKLIIPRESCAIAFALSGVRCPGKGEPFSEHAIAFMRRRIMQHEVEIEVETVDKTGTFIGSLWADRTNAGALLLQAGLAKLHPSFTPDRTAEGHLLISAETQAKNARIKVWEGYVEGQDAANAAASEASLLQAHGKQELVHVQVTEVLGGGLFYVVETTSGLLPRLEGAIKELQLSDAKTPAPGTFAPKKGEFVFAQFSADDSWARAMVVAAPADPTPARTSEYTVFYIDYGNQETLPFSRLRPLDQPSVAPSSFPRGKAEGLGLAQLCRLAHVKVPLLEEDFGQEAAEEVQGLTGGKTLLARVEERDASAGTKVKGQGSGVCWVVTLVDSETSTSVNAALLQAGLARLERRRGGVRNPALAAVLEGLKERQEMARQSRLHIWQYGDVDSDEEDDRGRRPGPPGGRK